MRNFILTYLLISLSFISFGQKTDVWIAYWNKDTTLIGFKDKLGNVKIEPKFMGFTTANKFEDIIAVMEEKNGGYESYHLTKSGRIAGRDSLYIFDNSADCESEGFIRFRDNKMDKVGIFDRNGKIVIPADYDELTRVRNGFIVALKGAKKKYWSNHKHSGCNHYRWKGGKQYLIDTNNKIIIKNFDFEAYLNFFSLKIESTASQDPVRQSFLGVNGQYYSFVDYEKEFLDMMTTQLLDNFTIENLNEVSYDSIFYWKDTSGWKGESKIEFLDRNFELIKNSLTRLSNKNSDYHIFIGGLNPFIYNGKEFEKYYNNCGEANESEYPLMSIVISNKIENDLIQDHFDFLRTDEGYKLISMTISNGEIK